MQVERQQDLTRAFVELADTLVAGYDVIELLQQLVRHCTDLLDISAAGLLLSDEQGRLRVAASSDDDIHLLELFQLQSEQGPCLECFSTRAPVVVGDPDEQVRRWPDFAAALHQRGHTSVAAVPLRLRAQAVGALNLFADHPGGIGADDLAAAQGLADVATIGILHERAVHDARRVSVQLQSALDSRVVIEQAKGLLAASGGSVADAFDLLRGHARRHGLPLTQVARSVVAGTLRVDQLLGSATAPPRSGRR